MFLRAIRSEVRVHSLLIPVYVTLCMSGLTNCQAQTSLGLDVTPIPLLLPAPEKKALLIFSESEGKVAAEACNTYGLKFDLVDGFDTRKQDYARYHTVMCGSNQMDYFGHEETRRPEAFEPLLKFVQKGGHLIIMGVFNGRNTEHLKRFGITCGYYHCSSFTTTPATKLFFRGAEKLIPANNKMHSVGTISVAGPHVAILNRGSDCDPSQPAMITLAHQLGRVTFNLVEPQFQDDFWLITATLNWAALGGPVPGSARPADSLLPRPDATALTAAETLLHEALETDYANIGQPAGKLNWAKLLIERDFSAESNPAVKYAAWMEARTNAAAVGELALALQAVNLLEETYQIDAIEMTLDTLTTVSRGTRDNAVVRSAARIACALMAKSINDDNYGVVPQITPVGRALAQKSQDKHLQMLIAYYDRRAKTLSKEFPKVASVLKAVKQAPEGDVSRTTAGRYYCFIKSDWRRGLPLLATGDDLALKSLAERELAAPAIAADQVALANSWWDFAETLQTEQRGVVQRHSGDWYYKALPGLTGVIQNSIKTKVTKIPSGKAQLVVQIIKHHGLGKFTITPEMWKFQLLSWGPPDAIRINDLNWDVKQSMLKNEGATRILVENVDINSAKLTQIRGRGKAWLEHTPDGLTVMVDDPLDGADTYEFKLTFGGK